VLAGVGMTVVVVMMVVSCKTIVAASDSVIGSIFGILSRIFGEVRSHLTRK
jgi:hypothetical protein